MGLIRQGNIEPPPSLRVFLPPYLKINIAPLSCGFPPQPYPLKGRPRLREDTFGARAQVLPMRRLSGGAMLCHLQCARFANRRRIAGVRPFCPRHSHGRRLLRLPLQIGVRRVWGDFFSSRSRVCGVSRAELFALNGNDTRRSTARRSAKRSQAVQPPLERRGALCDLASQMEN